ncbi:YnbE family lipoprotein [Novispirillum sp. DQ9]|uniref:YnbE family lipoprotein n=1 Tax=Novispirillum sp. DQ9 TaxID=3398612 RepID=UPI003C7ADD37
MSTSRLLPPVVALGLGLVLIACQPTVRVEAPEKPIVINLNVKIEQEVRIKVERDVESLLELNSELF